MTNPYKNCPVCKAKLVFEYCITDPGRKARVRAGFVGACGNCASFLSYDDQGELVLASEEQLGDLSHELRSLLVKIRRALNGKS